MTFGDKLREARKNKGYTQEQIAHLLGIAKSTYTGYEKGVREPDLFKIKRLVEVLDVDSSWLLGVDDSPSSITAAEYQAIKKYRALLRSPASMKLVLATLPPSSRTRPR